MGNFDEFAVYSKFYINGEKTNKFKLKRDLMYRDSAGTVHLVKKDFLSDLGSIPKPLWPVCPRDEYPSAYFLHDAKCEDPTMSRLDGDRLLKEALQASYAPKWKALLVYAGVRAYAMVKGLK